MQKKGFARPGATVSSNHHSSAPSTSDEELVTRVAAGNGLAMQVLFARHHVRVYRFALRLVANPTVAEDLTSEVFLSLWRQAHRFKGHSTVSTWLLAIAHNKARTEMRRRRGEVLDDDTLNIADPTDDPEVKLQIDDRSRHSAPLPHAAFAGSPRDDRPRLLSRKVDSRGCGDRRHSGQYREDPHLLRAP